MTDAALRLLVVNWQDLENPQAGGAEIHLHEIFGRLAARGHKVTLLCSGWPGCRARATVGGLDVHRVGGRYSFAVRARPYHRRNLASEAFDLVVEDINKIPLFTPLWVRPPVVALVPHLFGTTAFREASAPMAAAVWLAERPLPRVYRGVPFQAISKSTADDLVLRGVDRSRIRVIYPGIDHDRFGPDPHIPRFEGPTFAYVGRLKRYKGLEIVIDAVALLRDQGRRVRLIVAGKGDHEPALRSYAARRAPDAIEFLGFIPEDRKVELLRRAWAAVYPSPKEGWGITNVEAAACGTPVLASNSPGLRESVADGTSGLLVTHDDVAAWSEAFRRIADEPDLRSVLAAGAVRFAADFGWDRAADETESHLRSVVLRDRVDDTSRRPDRQQEMEERWSS
jgi:glycosyltransferase involved in cell wall biosynthesis